MTMAILIIVICAIFLFLVVVNAVSKSKKPEAQIATDDSKSRIEELRLEMISICVKAITSIEMSDTEKYNILEQGKEFFVENFKDSYFICCEEVSKNAFELEIDTFKLDENLRLRISERYQQFLLKPIKKNDSDFGFDDLIMFSGLYSELYNEESNSYKLNQVRIEMVNIAIATLTSHELSIEEKNDLFQDSLDGIRKSFPDSITKCLEEIAEGSYLYCIENYDKTLTDEFRDKFTRYKKAKRPLSFNDYGFDNIKSFAEMDKNI
jgi:hypothetical protein